MLLIFSTGLICLMPIPLKHLAILLQDLLLMMVLLSLILSNIEVLLGLYNIWHLHDLILLLVFSNCVNFYIILPLSTLKLQKGFWGMSRVLFTKEFFFLLVLWAFLPLLLQIRLEIPVTESPLLALLFSWGPILSLGHLRSKQQCLDHPWKLNIEL